MKSKDNTKLTSRINALISASRLKENNIRLFCKPQIQTTDTMHCMVHAATARFLLFMPPPPNRRGIKR